MSTVEEILIAVKHLSPDQQAEVRRRLELMVRRPNGEQSAGEERHTAGELDQRLQRALYEAGLISEIKPPVKRPRKRRPAITIKGKPLSETVIEDRR
jgi:hypothetical protein